MFLTLALFLAGSSQSPLYALKQQEPRATYTTPLTPKAVAACISDSVGPVSMLAHGSRHSIVSRELETSGVAIDMDGGAVKVWRFAPYEGEIRRRVEACL